MRSLPSIIHLDMDAFFAAVEQAAKPSLRGKPVIVGGLGGRGVVSTASYEARRFGVHSAMPMAQARRLCPNAAFLAGRFEAYRQVSEIVMGLLRELSPLVQPLSLDEAFVDLEAGPYGPVLAEADLATAERLVVALAEDLRADIERRTGLTASVGAAGSKLMAKIASEQAKPDGLVLIEPGEERAVLGPMPVRALPGIGPATEQVLRRAGLNTVADLAEAGEAELVQLLGRSHGVGVHQMSIGLDDRPVVADQDAKSVSVEDTFEVDLADRERVLREVDVLAARCVRRLRAAGRSGRTVVLKVRRFDFSTLTRSETLRGPTDDEAVITETARRLASQVDITGGVRLLGVGVSQLADYTQEDLFAQAEREEAAAEQHPAPTGEDHGPVEEEAVVRHWLPGQDVHHDEFGPGWVQGSGVGRVTVRFETPWSGPGRVRTFAVDDPALEPARPLPLRRDAGRGEHGDAWAGDGGAGDAPAGDARAGDGGAGDARAGDGGPEDGGAAEPGE
ncbi:DNA polymerase IV [Kitasatospora sp. A2-31]|uniref:DNA polymerase IV n=1 Tax=Kitasatospora sp. A2-31 TaxID=2916414 RepID=UPI001EEA4DEB|nr:DNA polymerase IV [Kitasatospora sp. A2-31]MCG6498174.1 DNA polymerase IV [Kitasatospora sp. A2-31]